MATPNLGLTHITQGQSNKETTANNQADGLDDAQNTITEIAVSGDFDLTTAQFRGAMLFRLTGTPGANFTMRVPASISRFFGVQNLTDATVTVEVEDEGTDSVFVSVGAQRLLHSDGSDINPYGAESSAGGGSVSVEDDGSEIVATATTLNFTGAGVTVSDAGGGQANIAITGGGGGTVESVEGGFKGFRYELGSGFSTSAAPSPPETVTFDTEVFDEAGMTPSSGVFTVPADLDGKYALFTVGYRLTGGGEDPFYGYVVRDPSGTPEYLASGAAPGGDMLTVSSGPVLLTAGETYAFQIFTQTTNTVGATDRSFCSMTLVEYGLDGLEYVEFTGDRVLVQGDFNGNRVLKCTDPYDVSLFVPDDLVVKNALTIIQEDEGTVTLVPDGSGVILKSRNSALTTAGQYAVMQIFPDTSVDTDYAAGEYYVTGDVV